MKIPSFTALLASPEINEAIVEEFRSGALTVLESAGKSLQTLPAPTDIAALSDNLQIANHLLDIQAALKAHGKRANLESADFRKEIKLQRKQYRSKGDLNHKLYHACSEKFTEKIELPGHPVVELRVIENGMRKWDKESVFLDPSPVPESYREVKKSLLSFTRQFVCRALPGPWNNAIAQFMQVPIQDSLSTLQVLYQDFNSMKLSKGDEVRLGAIRHVTTYAIFDSVDKIPAKLLYQITAKTKFPFMYPLMQDTPCRVLGNWQSPRWITFEWHHLRP